MDLDKGENAVQKQSRCRTIVDVKHHNARRLSVVGSAFNASPSASMQSNPNIRRLARAIRVNMRIFVHYVRLSKDQN